MINNRLKYLIASIGVAFAVFLMMFQVSLFMGFLKASSVVIDAAGGDIWITAHGVACFEHSAPIPSRIREIALATPGIKKIDRIIADYGVYQTPSGGRETILVIGTDIEGKTRLPLPMDGANVRMPQSALIDESRMERLGVIDVPWESEINRHRVKIINKITGFASFLEISYVFVSYPDAIELLNYSDQKASYLLIETAMGTSIPMVQQQLQRRLPEFDVLTQAEFSRKASRYWLNRTGVGNAVLLTALIGLVIGFIIVSQTMYAATMDAIEEFATLKALGASDWFIIKIILWQASICAVAGSVAGFVAVFPFLKLAKTVIAFIDTPAWLPYAIFLLTLLICWLAAITSIRRAVTIEPGRVFRA